MRSKLFVPASRPELFLKALASEADALSFDLEDAVHESRKDEARDILKQFLSGKEIAQSAKTIIVRINDASTPHFIKDLDAVVLPSVHVINVPKLNGPEDVLSVVSILETLERARGIPTPVRILANIETPLALRRAAEIGRAHFRIMGIQVGLADLFEPMAIDRTNIEAVRQVQLLARLAAGEANVDIFDGAYVDIPNKEGYAAEATAVKRLGYTGKTCIHPSQIEIANAIFLPTDAEIEHSRNVIESTRGATAAGTGAFVVDGKMIDVPYIERAKRILKDAERLGLIA